MFGGSMKDRDWNNYNMRKFGVSIRMKIAEAYLPFARAVGVVRAENNKILDRMEKMTKAVRDKDK